MALMPQNIKEYVPKENVTGCNYDGLTCILYKRSYKSSFKKCNELHAPGHYHKLK